MAIIDYITSAELKATLSLTGQSYADADISLAITAASRAIDHRTGRQFWPDDNASARTFTPGLTNVLEIADFYELTSVVWDGTTRVLDTDFYREPILGPPWNVLRTATGIEFPLSDRSVTVTAKWGWNAVPEEIKQATKILAARLARRAREAAFGVAGLGIDSGGIYVSRYDPDVDMMLRPYIRTALFV
jgi:hypothetical protein